MPGQKDRVIIDTNLWISFLLLKNFISFDKIISNRKIILLFSLELLDEIVDVTQREKFRKYFSLDDIERVLVKIKERSEFINIISVVTDCRDPKDNFLLSLSIDGDATHLITGDKDLLILGTYVNTKILTIAEYLKKQ